MLIITTGTAKLTSNIKVDQRFSQPKFILHKNKENEKKKKKQVSVEVVSYKFIFQRRI